MLFRLTPHPHERVEQIVNYFVLSFGHASLYSVVARYRIPCADAGIEALATMWLRLQFHLSRKPAAHKD
jgi:hypothetical protein